MFKIIPIGYRVLVKSILKTETESGIILAADESKERGAMDKGVVLALGNTAGTHADLKWQGLLEVGNEVVWAKYAGKQIHNPDDPKGIYILLNDADILGVLQNDKT